MPPQENQPQPQNEEQQQAQARADANKAALTKLNRMRRVLFNPYLIGLVVLMIVGGAVAYYAFDLRQDSVSIDGSDFESSTIDEEDFARLAADQAEIDSTNQTLNVTANSVFNGTMLVRSSLDVQGQLRVGEELALNELAVAGQAAINNLDIANDLNVQGSTQFNEPVNIQDSLTIDGGITVSGSGSFSGNLSANTIEASNLSFSGNLTMSGRIITGGAQTSAGSGGAVGAGGTVSVSGNDTAGTVNVNTGSGTSSGTLVTVQFGEGYSQTPRVNITPVGAPAGGIDWYVTRNNNGFSIGTSSPPPSGSNFSFDYFVVQ